MDCSIRTFAKSRQTKIISVFLWLIGGLFSLILSPCIDLHAQQNPYEFKIGHPRIIMTKYDELAMRFVLMEDPLAKKLKDQLKRDADKLLSSKEIKYKLDQDHSLKLIARQYLKRIITLSMAYRIFEEDKYSDKAIDQMLYVADLPDWNPGHFLDVAELTVAMSIGYDWNFYHLNLREKETIRNKIVENALKPGLEVYQNADDKPHVWYKTKDHWNQVCAGGLIVGALAVGEDFPDLKNNVIYQAVKNLLPTLDQYQPDGVWYEGPDYWQYANDYLTLAMASLQSALEHDFGLSDRLGIKESARNYLNLVGTSGRLFNFGDSKNANFSMDPFLLWYGKNFKQPNVSAQAMQMLTQSISFEAAERDPFYYLALPWLDGQQESKATHPRAVHCHGMIDLMFFRSGEAKESVYLAAKGGKGSLPHQQLDAGSFVLDADGERWALDLGYDRQSNAAHDQEEKQARWENIINTNKAHNTLVIGDHLQNPDGAAPLIDYNEDINQPFGIFDLSAVYPKTAKVLRGFKLISDDKVLVRDEVTFSGDSQTIRWGMMTDASVELFGDKVVLTKNGKSFYLRLYSPEKVIFQMEEPINNMKGIKLIFAVLNKQMNQHKVSFTVVLGKKISGVSDMIANSQLGAW